ncbi:transmembrane protein 269 isoform X3 [Pongo pygmaeus]|uniref:transmembrane protein 269 isoform X3 n=1 Tax=Pongo pygmaeus TaxID=9600 RepID=UPI00300CC9DE
MPCPQGEPPGKGTSFFLSHDQSHSQINEVSWKDVTSALSLTNMVLGLFSIIFSFSRVSSGNCKSASLFGLAGLHFRKRHYASWMLLVSFLLDVAVRAMTSHINICSKLGVDGLLSGILAIIYVSAASFHLSFYSSGVPSIYKGLPCPYASCILASTSLLTKGNRFILCCMASLMILFMMDQSYYPYDKILESENWKKLVYIGGVIMLFFSPLSLSAFYCLMWSLSYIFFPDALWGKAACLSPQH